MNASQQVSRPFHILSAVVFTAGLASFILSWNRSPAPLTPQLILIVLAALLSENFAFSLPAFSVSLSYPLTMGAIVLAGPAAAALVAVVTSTNYQEIRAHRPVSVLLFNMGQLVFVASAGAWVYVILGGRVLGSAAGGFAPLHAPDFPRILIPMIATAAFCALGNMVITSFGVSLLQKLQFQKLLVSMSAFAPTQVALALVGYLLAQVMAISLIALPLFIFPLTVARQLYQRYTSLRAAYADTVRSLIGALEAKDPYTRGHSERVAICAAELGRAMGLEPRALERLEYAALLHDLGKLAVPGSVLTKPGRLGPEEMERIREHPARGARMIGRIPPLRDLADMVQQHHERIDGTGYPAGIARDDISLCARVLAVADSYDAMTTTRAYRPALTREQALEELLLGQGTQFDEAVVSAFIEHEVGLRERDAEIGELGPIAVKREPFPGSQVLE